MAEKEGQWFEAFGLLQHRDGPPVLELPGVNHARAVEYFRGRVYPIIRQVEPTIWRVQTIVKLGLKAYNSGLYELWVFLCFSVHSDDYTFQIYPKD